MAEVDSILAEPRSGAGKGAARALRRQGRVPAIIYGGGEPPMMISLEARQIKRELNNPRFWSTLHHIDIAGESLRVLPREVQSHPVTELPIHLDFMRAAAGGTITVEVPVVFLNEDTCRGLKRGGVLNIVRREVELVCPVDRIPAELELDLAEADIGDSLHISHITLPEGVHPTITDRDFTIAGIVAPTVTPAEEDEAAEAAAEAEAEAEAEHDEDED